MSDENSELDEFKASLTSYQYDDLHSTYLAESLKSISFLSLWDECLLKARDMIYDGVTPNGIKKVNPVLLKKFLKFDPDNEDIDIGELLSVAEPIQQWLSDQIAKSIDNKEIIPEILARSIDGKIDPRRTYCDSGDISHWLSIRGVVFSFDYIAGFDEYSRAMDQLHDELLNTAAALSAATRDPYWWVPVIDEDDAQRLVIENVRLQSQLFTYKQSHEEPPPPSKKIHGNAERFSKNREEVLGAALSVIIQWPDQCKNNSGKFEATKIAYLIDQKSNLYWPDTGKPSLGLEKMEREISKWINR